MLANLLQASSHRLMRQALSRSRRRADAEDALGDACVQFLRFYDGAPGDPALHWMLLVVKRCAWAIGRGRVAERPEVLLADDRIGPAEMVERAEETEQLVEAIEQLKPDERVALILLGLGCTYEEIHELRGWSTRKVRRCLDEGRARVRNLLAKGGELAMPAPLAPMDSLQPIGFTDALLRLQALIHTDIDVTINFDGRFFGCGLAGELARVETLPPDNVAIKVVLDDGQGFFLDPKDAEAFLGRREDDDRDVLELRLGFGASVIVESSPGE